MESINENNLTFAYIFEFGDGTASGCGSGSASGYGNGLMASVKHSLPYLDGHGKGMARGLGASDPEAYAGVG